MKIVSQTLILVVLTWSLTSQAQDGVTISPDISLIPNPEILGVNSNGQPNIEESGAQPLVPVRPALKNNVLALPQEPVNLQPTLNNIPVQTEPKPSSDPGDPNSIEVNSTQTSPPTNGIKTAQISPSTKKEDAVQTSQPSAKTAKPSKGTIAKTNQANIPSRTHPKRIRTAVLVAPRPTSTVELSGNEVSIILSDKRFFPSRIRLKQGIKTKLFFTTVNQKPAALVLEKLKLQAWLNKQPVSETERNLASEINREVSSARITELHFEPEVGTYSFHDALSGAQGEIVVE